VGIADIATTSFWSILAKKMNLVNWLISGLKQRRINITSNYFTLILLTILYRNPLLA